jgi:glutathione S-transferase
VGGTALTTLTISSRNYSSWSLRGWLLCKLAGLDFKVKTVSVDDPSARAELLLLSPSCLVPCLDHNGAQIWDTLAIAEYLDETFPDAGMLPKDRVKRARCRSVSGEMHSGFYNLRSALPMNLKARYPNFKTWAGAKPDIARVKAIWQECLHDNGGPYLFGKHLSMADAMYAPVCTRFLTYDVEVDEVSAAYCKTIMKWPALLEWIEAAKAEPDELAELDAEF